MRTPVFLAAALIVAFASAPWVMAQTREYRVPVVEPEVVEPVFEPPEAEGTPACCGRECTAGRCCPGTVCMGSRCVPEVCAHCGAVGCRVEFSTCTAGCNPPACCLQRCRSDADCCTGARCIRITDRIQQCLPEACDMCSGMRPTCELSTECEIRCLPPSTCGQPCQQDAECGPTGTCRQLAPDNRRCVPQAFDEICSACQGHGCVFSVDTCSVSCAP